MREKPETLERTTMTSHPQVSKEQRGTGDPKAPRDPQDTQDRRGQMNVRSWTSS